MTPAVNQTQTVWSSRLSIEPAAWSINYTDYWGTAVTTFEVHERHSRLTVRSQAVVETRGDGLPWDTDRRVPTSDLGWAALQDRGVTDSMSEFLTVNDRTAPPEELLELASRRRPDSRLDWPGWTSAGWWPNGSATVAARPLVTSTAPEVWEGGPASARTTATWCSARCARSACPHGTCRDTCFPSEDITPNATVEGESHSWVEWWCGSWVGYDPTQRRRLSEHYVRVGHGRDYGDVAPLRGTYSGGASEMFVTVEMTQLG